jgi:hypothetical protein
VVEFDIAATAPADFAATDMLHRRIPLTYQFRFMMGESILFIKTNTPLIHAALGGHVRGASSIGEAGAAAWEIAVEVQSENASLPGAEKAEGFETCSFGPSKSLRMGSGSWFAYTPPSLSGVGFAMVSRDESCQIRELAAFLDKIMLFLSDNETQSNSSLAHEVLA